MAGMVELSDQEYETTMINMPGALIDKAGRVRKQMGTVSREMGILRKNKREMLEIKHPAAQMQNGFNGLIS